MICWDCGKEITDSEDEFGCDTCETTLCKDCYIKQNGFCNECLSDMQE